MPILVPTQKFQTLKPKEFPVKNIKLGVQRFFDPMPLKQKKFPNNLSPLLKQRKLEAQKREQNIFSDPIM